MLFASSLVPTSQDMLLVKHAYYLLFFSPFSLDCYDSLQN